MKRMKIVRGLVITIFAAMLLTSCQSPEVVSESASIAPSTTPELDILKPYSYSESEESLINALYGPDIPVNIFEFSNSKAGTCTVWYEEYNDGQSYGKSPLVECKIYDNDSGLISIVIGRESIKIGVTNGSSGSWLEEELNINGNDMSNESATSSENPSNVATAFWQDSRALGEQIHIVSGKEYNLAVFASDATDQSLSGPQYYTDLSQISKFDHFYIVKCKFN